MGQGREALPDVDASRPISCSAKRSNRPAWTVRCCRIVGSGGGGFGFGISGLISQPPAWTGAVAAPPAEDYALNSDLNLDASLIPLETARRCGVRRVVFASSGGAV
jgi:hypothetical protein